MKFKTKLSFGGAGLILTAMLISTVAVSVTVWKQNENATYDNILKASKIIAYSLKETREQLSADTRQILVSGDVGNNIHFLSKFKNQPRLTLVADAYRKTAVQIHQTRIANRLVRITAFDTEGNLIVHARAETDRELLIYPLEKEGEIQYNLAEIKQGEKVENAQWRTVLQWPFGDLPTTDFLKDAKNKDMTWISSGNRQVLIDACAEIPARIFNKEKNEFESGTVGILRTTRFLNSSFTKRMAVVTDTHVNIFTTDGFTAGSYPAYKTLAPLPSAQPRLRTDNLNLFTDAIRFQEKGYTRGILHLSDGAASNADAHVRIAILQSRDFVKTNTKNMVFIMFLVSVACLAIMLILILIFANSLTRPIREIIRELGGSMRHLTTVSDKYSDASRTLAELAAQEASYVQEMSSSLEEISVMMHKNAESTERVAGLMKETLSTVDTADKSNRDLNLSMTAIAASGDQIRQINKVIEDIAFQTNLLSLNASVEAARAGETGAGFAVVAEEVRSLAIRSGESVKMISELIEGASERIVKGSQLVSKSDEAFVKVAESARTVHSLIEAIRTAAEEQSSGIEHLNKAAAKIDRIVQHVAESSDASAETAVDLKQHARHMKDASNRLFKLFGVS